MIFDYFQNSTAGRKSGQLRERRERIDIEIEFTRVFHQRRERKKEYERE